MRLEELVTNVMDSPPPLYCSDGSAYEDARLNYQKLLVFLDRELELGQSVGIMLPKEPDYLLCIMACMTLGIAYVPLKEDFPKSRLQEIKEDSGLKLIIDMSCLTRLYFTESVALGGFQRAQASVFTDEMPLYIIFTSGSTGRPKGVVISRGAFDSYAQWLNEYLPNVTSKDRLLQVTEFTFDISLIDLILYLKKRTPLYFTSFNGAIFKLAQDIASHKITVISTVPNNVNMLLSNFIVSKANFSSLKTLMIGGARFSFGLYEKVCTHFGSLNVLNFYGPTEFTIYSHAKRIRFNESVDCINNNVSIGVDNKEVRSDIHSDGLLCEAHQTGELLLSGKQVMSGYINDPQKTGSVFIEIDGRTYYRTGDLAYKNENNEVFVVGRLDDTIKYRGYRINLLDIDSYVAKLKCVQDVTTIAVPDEIKENITVCFIILSEGGGGLTAKGLKAELSELLVDYQIPEKIIFTDKFPVNVSGKVCKKQLLKIYLDKKC